MFAGYLSHWKHASVKRNQLEWLESNGSDHKQSQRAEQSDPRHADTPRTQGAPYCNQRHRRLGETLRRVTSQAGFDTLSPSFFACDKAADHTSRFARNLKLIPNLIG